jgi:hypothetical protein
MWFKKSFKSTHNSVSYQLQKKIAKYIVEDAEGTKYSLKRVGAFDYYEGYYAQNYQYLLWWMGNEPKDNNDILYTIYEDINRYERSEDAEVIFEEYDVLITREKS